MARIALHPVQPIPTIVVSNRLTVVLGHGYSQVLGRLRDIPEDKGEQLDFT